MSSIIVIYSFKKPEDVSVSSAVVNVVDQLRIRVAQLQEQVKQRDCEIAFLHLEASQKVSLAAAAAAAAAETKEQSSQADNVNKTMNTTVIGAQYHPMMRGNDQLMNSFSIRVRPSAVHLTIESWRKSCLVTSTVHPSSLR